MQDTNLDFDEYFKPNERNKGYSVETIKGYRRLLRTVFNEAVRYDWITKNPVCATKVGSGNSNSSLRPVNEKEVYSIAEAQEFMKALDELPEDLIYKRVPIKFMLLTGVRAGELNGLRWSDIDFDKQVVHIRRNRLVAKGYGIKDGRISRLWIDGMANYDRGWDKIPTTPKAKQRVKELLEHFDKPQQSKDYEKLITEAKTKAN